MSRNSRGAVSNQIHEPAVLCSMFILVSIFTNIFIYLKQAVREAAATICPRPFDLLTLKVVSESRVTWATTVQTS